MPALSHASHALSTCFAPRLPNTRARATSLSHQRFPFEPTPSGMVGAVASSLDCAQTIQAFSLWPWGSSSAPTPAPVKYDPTDPKQNPLNPQGLKPYVSLGFSFAWFLTLCFGSDAARAPRQSLSGTIASSNTRVITPVKRARKLSRRTSHACASSVSSYKHL
jgi:hypothetical protein